MTRTTVHSRMTGHLKDQKSRLNKSPMFRHDLDRHARQTQKYVTTIIGREKKLVKINCLEGIHIEKVPDHLSINKRQESGRGGIVHIQTCRVN